MSVSLGVFGGSASDVAFKFETLRRLLNPSPKSETLNLLRVPTTRRGTKAICRRGRKEITRVSAEHLYRRARIQVDKTWRRRRLTGGVA